MSGRARDVLRIACLAGLVLVVLYFVTLGREPLNHFLERLRQWGPLPFYAAFAVLISVGFPSTPFLVAAGAAFDLRTNLIAVPVAYTASLCLSYVLASGLFRQTLTRTLAARAPSVAGLLRENPATMTLLVRLTPGFPYALQNCLLVSAYDSFAVFFLASLPPLVFYGLMYASLGRSLLAGNYWLLAVLGIVLVGVMFFFRRLARRRAARSSGASGGTD